MFASPLNPCLALRDVSGLCPSSRGASRGGEGFHLLREHRTSAGFVPLPAGRDSTRHLPEKELPPAPRRRAKCTLIGLSPGIMNVQSSLLWFSSTKVNTA